MLLIRYNLSRRTFLRSLAAAPLSAVAAATLVSRPAVPTRVHGLHYFDNDGTQSLYYHGISREMFVLQREMNRIRSLQAEVIARFA
jgi:hypothetical protein